MLSQSKKRRGVRLPAHLQNPPHVWPWLAIYWTAYKDLQTDRHWAEGPIPWSSRRAWAKDHGLDEVATEMLHIHLRQLDLAYREWLGHNKGSGTGADDHDGSGGTRAEHAARRRPRS